MKGKTFRKNVATFYRENALKEKLILCTVLLTLSTSSFGMKSFFNFKDGPDDLLNFTKGKFKKGVPFSADELLYYGLDQVHGEFVATAASDGKHGYFLKKYKSGKESELWVTYSTQDWDWGDTSSVEKTNKLPRSVKEEMEWILKEGQPKDDIVVEFEDPLEKDKNLPELAKEEWESCSSEEARKKSFLEILYSLFR